jgi:hypothetical protein
MKKKSIDKLYQERLQDFGQIPEEHVWESIATSLDRKKKKRRLLPIWWQIGGVAAVIAIVFYLSLSSNDPLESVPILTDTENSSSPSPVIDTPSDAPILEVVPEDTSVASVPVADETKEKEVREGAFKGVPTNQLSLVNSSQESNQLSEPPESKTMGNPSTSLAQNTGIDKEPLLKEEEINNTVSNQTAQDTPLAVSEVIKNTTDEQNAISIATNKEETKKSVFDEIEKDAVLAEKNRPKWAMGARVAPVFFSSLAQGSPIHSNFENNSKSGNINFSYGVSVSYEISKKLQVRSGIHKVDYGYDTNDVSFSSSLNAATNSLIANIDYSLNSKNLVVKSNLSSRQAVSTNAMDVSATDPSMNGRMIQEFGYLEIPLELTYALLNKKIGVNVIGGVSSLFLTNNSVILESEGVATSMGEANNINDLNLSTNIGIGIFYRIGNNMQLNVEPMFKYQLNTFSNATGNFQPYSLGVYSGLNVRF